MFQWRTAEYDLIEKGVDWFIAVFVIAISIAVSAFMFGNILFGVFVIVAAIALSLQGARDPDILDVEVNERGISINEKFLAYKDLNAFWVEYDSQLLLIRTQKLFHPHIVLPVTDVDSDELAEYLSNFLEEEEMEESLFHKILEYLGF